MDTTTAHLHSSVAWTVKLEQFRHEAGLALQKAIEALLAWYWSQMRPQDLSAGFFTADMGKYQSDSVISWTALKNTQMQGAASRHSVLLLHELHLLGYNVCRNWNHVAQMTCCSSKDVV